MAAEEHLSVQQFPVSQLRESYANDYGTHVRGKDLPDYFPEHSLKQGPLEADIAKNGVKEPLDIAAPVWQGEQHYILNGHHRAAAAIRQNLDTVPARVHHPVDTGNGWEYPSYHIKRPLA